MVKLLPAIIRLPCDALHVLVGLLVKIWLVLLKRASSIWKYTIHHLGLLLECPAFISIISLISSYGLVVFNCFQRMHFFELRVLAKYLIALKLLIKFLPLQVLFNFWLVTVHHNPTPLCCNKEQVDSKKGRRKDYWNVLHIDFVVLLPYWVVQNSSIGMQAVLDHHTKHQGLVGS